MMEKESLIHKPVLLNEVMEWLRPSANDKFVDATTGCGGHTVEILGRILPEGFLWGIDCDSAALSISYDNLNKISNRFCLIKDNFKNLTEIAEDYNIKNLNGILFDLGMSSLQVDTAERGFSFKKHGLLDMRFDNADNMFTAKRFVNELSGVELEKIIFKYGEEKYAKKIAKAIVKSREHKKIETTEELADIIQKAVLAPPRIKTNSIRKTFQSLRIAVNNELESLKEVLPVAVSLLKAGGRLALISFHSLEDRIIKSYFKQESKDCICNPKQPVCNCTHKAQLKLLFSKPITPTKKEIEQNNRSRSAKLRVAEKL